jgi:hypothetical protein
MNVRDTALALFVSVAVLATALGSSSYAVAPHPTRISESRAALRAARLDDIDPILDEVSGDRVFVTIDSLSSYWTRRVGRPGNLWSADYITRCFEELGYEEAHFDSFWCNATGSTESNIVFTKQGAASLEGYVVVCAHFDGVTHSVPDDPDERSPGADDNASGVAGLLEIARIVKDLPLLRDVVFVCFNAEELGYVGSTHFVEDLVAAGDSVFVCLNLDCIAYTDGSWEASVDGRYPDFSLFRAIEGLMRDYTSITPIPHWKRSSDHWPFIEAGIPAIMIWEEPLTPLLHTPEDNMDYLDQAYAEDMTRAYLATLLATAELEGVYLPIRPTTHLEETCATDALGLPPGATAEFRWWSEDFDGFVAAYEYRLIGPSAPDTTYHQVSASVESLEFILADEGIHRFEVRAVDDEGLRDSSPVAVTVPVGMGYAYPELQIETDMGGWAWFRGNSGTTSDFPDTLFEGESVQFTWSGTADRYCSELVGYAWAWDDTTVWHPPAESMEETLFAVELEPGDHVLRVKAVDDLGYETIAALPFHVAAFGGAGPLLVVDDFNHWLVDDESEDAFFDTLLAGREWSEWDPDDHVSGSGPAPPPAAVLANAEHVLWSVDNSSPQLGAVSVGGYNYLEGYVRAGGNLILAGWCPTQALDGFPDYPRGFLPGEFLYDFAGLGGSRNTGGSSNPNPPSQYGFAFLGAISTGVFGFEDVPVDTAGKWGPYFATYGGVPYCDAFELAPDGQDLFSFRSYINPDFQSAVCGVRRFGTSGEGSVAVLGFPLYYLQTGGARDMVGRILDDFENWTIPAELLAFEWIASADSVAISWSVVPEAGVQGFHLWRRDPGDATFEELTEAMIVASPEGGASFTDRDVATGSSYEYRLGVVERWGGTTAHGPWLVTTPERLPSALRLASVGPNPFADVATITLAVPSPGERVSVEVYDLAGRSVAVICDNYFEPGVHELEWSGHNRSAQSVASGVYFVRARGERAEATQKLVRIR